MQKSESPKQVRQNISGWIILDKPSGITSAHAVAKVKRLLKPEKIGHAGTLDPLASGILPLALGEATKTVAFMMDYSKSYSFTAQWGQERDTDDSQGQVVETSEKRPSRADIEALLPKFRGAIQQVPPDYSAIKVGGKRAYDAAREGNALELKAREVLVKRLELVIPSVAEGSFLAAQDPSTSLCYAQDDSYPIENSGFICHCGKGTYIRSLARDIGRQLGTYGHVTALRRLGVGSFHEKHAISLEVMEEMVHKGDLSFLRPVESALDDIPACDVSHDQAARLKRGQNAFLPPSIAEDIELGDGTIVLARSEGQLVAVCSVTSGSMKPVRVFNL